MTPAQEARIHRVIKTFLSARDQGRVMGTIREVLLNRECPHNQTGCQGTNACRYRECMHYSD